MRESKLFTDSKRLNIAIILLIILDLIILIMGLVYIITATFQSYHVDYMGITESQIRRFNPKLMVLISFFLRMVGFGFLSVSIGGFIIIFASFKKREKWSWLLYLIQHLLIATPLIWITLVVGGLSLILVIIGWILLILGMLLSYKEFFR